MSSFNIVDETGKSREAQEVLNFEFESDKYCLYSIRRDNENYNLFISKIIDHGMGNIVLVDLNDDKKSELDNIVRYIVQNSDVDSLKKARINVLNDVSLYGVDNLLFTSYKAYVFSIKEEMYTKLKNAFVKKVNDTQQFNFGSLMNKSKVDAVTFSISDESVNFKENIPQNVSERDNILFEGNKDDLNNVKDIIRKINIERLDINNNEDLEKLFVKEKIKTPNNDRGFVSSNITIFILGILSFVVLAILLMLNF